MTQNKFSSNHFLKGLGKIMNYEHLLEILWLYTIAFYHILCICLYLKFHQSIRGLLHLLTICLVYPIKTVYKFKSHNVSWQRVFGQVFDIDMSFVNNLCQLFAFNHFFKYPHGHFLLKMFRVLDDIVPNDLGNSRAPRIT